MRYSHDRPLWIAKQHSRWGFTLIEMLIAVTLVLMMMTMFAEIFQIAAGSMSKQRAISENDQRARMLDVVIRGDLMKRTFDNVTPFVHLQDTLHVAGGLSRRDGYWYYAENNPFDDTDDVLCFTAEFTNEEPSGYSPFLGRATPLNTAGPSGSEPDFDDGIPPSSASGIPTNNSGQSACAEIAYFLRGGNLCRRVLLIRDKDDTDSQPRHSNGQRVIGTTYSAGTGSFYRDFDYSAFYYRGKYSASSGLSGGGVRFHGRNPSLSNDANSETLLQFESTPVAPLQPQDQFRYVSLGIPQTRFGHDPWTGLPREHASAGADGQVGTGDDEDFIGRFTMIECSHADFGYPGYLASIPTNGRPDFDQSPVSTHWNLPYDSMSHSVTAYTTSPQHRRGEDVLMSNVLGFDVKVWDPLAVDSTSGVTGMFVDLGDSSGTSFNPSGTSFVNTQNPIYSPPSKFRYDTWHPRAEAIYPGDPTIRNSSPPFTAAVTAVQITINYRDPSSDQVRQFTLVQSLVKSN
jgi:type II secretory pathway pseudopilin PulG